MSAERWAAVLLEPPALSTEATFAPWFDALAARLLNGCRLIAGRVAHRLTEVEVYYHGPGHHDPFAHGDPIQVSTGLWYFHRTAGVLRGGSFKGLDLTFGGPQAYGGVLFRGMEPEGRPLIDGPSLCVDHLIALTGTKSVTALHVAAARRPSWDAANPLHLEWLNDPAVRPVLKTARVGLSLRRQKPSPDASRFLLCRYRHLTEPRRIAKGKLHMALALHADGAGAMEIRERTGVTNAALLRYIAGFEEGTGEAEFAPYFGVELGPRELARLHGLWHERFRTPSSPAPGR